MIIILYSAAEDAEATRSFTNDLFNTLGHVTYDLDVDAAQMPSMFYRHSTEAANGDICLIGLRPGIVPGTVGWDNARKTTNEWRELIPVQYVQVYAADYPA